MARSKRTRKQPRRGGMTPLGIAGIAAGAVAALSALGVISYSRKSRYSPALVVPIDKNVRLQRGKDDKTIINKTYKNTIGSKGSQNLRDMVNARITP